MPTARSSTEPVRPLLGEPRRAVGDVGALLRFRLAALRGPARTAVPAALASLVVITVAVSVAPARLPELMLARADVALLLPSGLLGVLVIAVVSAAASGGGRELAPRDEAVAFPVSPTTDHLGALLLAPLNIAWLLQAWVVLAATSYAVGPRPTLGAAVLTVYAWLAATTAVAQVLAWAVEWVRRGPYGVLVVRATAAALAGAVAAVLLGGSLTVALDNSPTLTIAVGVFHAAEGRWGPWLSLMALLLAATAIAVVLGSWLAGRAARRPARDELRAETSRHPARPDPASDLVALLRLDRAGVWRSVPMRRGMVVLALFPGLVAIGGSFGWDMLGIFPGLVASGGALLFGVNCWCLDGRGALWRESLPADARLAFAARTLVLLEMLLVATAVTMLLASARAGIPTVSQLVAVGCASVVVTVQVVATSMRWSVRRPFAVDLRSARATPAPPLVMVGYSARLAVSTSLTGLVFTLTANAPWAWSLLVAAPLLAWPALMLHRSAKAWSRPEPRSRVISVVTG